MDISNIIVPQTEAANEIISRIHADLVEECREVRAKYEAVEPDGTKEQQKEYWTPLKELDAKYKGMSDELADRVASQTGIDRLFVQIAANRKAVKELYKEKWEKFCAIRDADKPAEPVRAIACVIYATDAGFAKLCASIRGGKIGGVHGYQCAPDEATEKKVVKIFENN